MRTTHPGTWMLSTSWSLTSDPVLLPVSRFPIRWALANPMFSVILSSSTKTFCSVTLNSVGVFQHFFIAHKKFATKWRSGWIASHVIHQLTLHGGTYLLLEVAQLRCTVLASFTSSGRWQIKHFKKKFRRQMWKTHPGTWMHVARVTLNWIQVDAPFLRHIKNIRIYIQKNLQWNVEWEMQI